MQCVPDGPPQPTTTKPILTFRPSAAAHQVAVAVAPVVVVALEKGSVGPAALIRSDVNKSGIVVVVGGNNSETRLESCSRLSRNENIWKTATVV